jgi:hypothetical protein
MGEYEDLTRKIEKRLPILLVIDDPLGLGRDIIDYRLSRYKQANLAQYNQRKIKIAKEIIELRKDVDIFWKNRKQR